jgi:UbiD family decarboxylase
MGYRDLREWLELVEADGELRHISGAHWNLEMSSLAEIIGREGRDPLPAILFDDIPDSPKGYRALFGILSSIRRLGRSLGLPDDQLEKMDKMTLLRNWRKKMSEAQYVPPKLVTSGPVLENVVKGDKVDLTQFPSPLFHEQDKSRYIGTAVAVIMKDPDTGWVNIGTYRCMLVDRDRFTWHAVEGAHGRSIFDGKYHARGQVMPIAIAMGVDPALFVASTIRAVPYNVTEYDFAGGMKGEPIEIIEGPYTKLPLPARAEIVIEGECHPGELIDEGPFGEWHGYYANLGLRSVPEPVVHVKTILHRNDPILSCMMPSAPPCEESLEESIRNSATIWEKLDKCDLPGIKGVWAHEVGIGCLFNIVSMKQQYAGHAMQVATVASQFPTRTGAFLVVVDDDIDPCNLNDVMWAVSTRVNPERDIHILPRCVGASEDPIISPEEKRKYKVPPKPLFKSRVIIDATLPFEWKEEWYPIARVSPDLRKRLLDKWQSVLKELF